MRFQGKVALVTGGGRGIGAEIARQLAAAGATVAINARTAADVEGVAAEIAGKGHKAKAFNADLSKPDEARALVGQVEKALGPIEFLVNNAGIATTALVAKLPLDDWNLTFAVNVTAPFLLTQAALPGMMERKSGRVIMIASVASRRGAKYLSAYAASKHAVLGFTRCAAAEAAEFGVTVNAICPGFVDTDMVAKSVARISDRTGMPKDQALAAIANQSPQKRLLTPSEVAHAVLNLCDPESRGVNGQAIVIDGGALLS